MNTFEPMKANLRELPDAYAKPQFNKYKRPSKKNLERALELALKEQERLIEEVMSWQRVHRAELEKTRQLEAENARLKAERNEMALDQVTRAMIKAQQPE